MKLLDNTEISMIKGPTTVWSVNTLVLASPLPRCWLENCMNQQVTLLACN